MFTINTEDHTDQINKFVSELQNWFEKSELYNGLSNSDILDFHYDEKIYQFGNGYIMPYDVNVIAKEKGNHFNIILKFRNDNEYFVGTIPKDESFIKNYFDKNKEPYVRILGGRYKQVVIQQDGSDHVKSFREPYTLKIDFKQKDAHPSDVIYDNETETNLYKISKASKEIGNTMESAGDGMAGCGCLIIALVTIPFIILLITML